MADAKEQAAANPEEKPKPQETDAPKKKKMSKKRKQILIVLTVIFTLIALIWLMWYLIWGQFEEYTDDAYVSGNMVRLMPQVAGTVVAINTDDTQFVVEGQPVIKLDDADMRLALERAKANLANSVRKVRQYFEDVKQAQASGVLRKADLENARYDLTRRQGLVGERAISREEMQHYITALQVAQAQLDLANAKLSAAQALVQNTSLYNHPEVQRAKVGLKNAYLNFYRTTIIAPVTGYVAKRTVQVGQQVSQRTAMLAIVPLKQVWIDANYKESQLGRIRIGQKVTFTVDAYSGVTFHGTVQGLSAGTGSAFDLLPPQNATGNWIKIVQRLPVRILLDQDELAQHPLRIGLSARITTGTYDTDGPILNKQANVTAVYLTDVYANELAYTNKMIDEIIKANAADMSLITATTHAPDHAGDHLQFKALGMALNLMRQTWV
jgi:membrane fusion protein (multidrug efflux system)